MSAFRHVGEPLGLRVKMYVSAAFLPPLLFVLATALLQVMSLDKLGLWSAAASTAAVAATFYFTKKNLAVLDRNHNVIVKVREAAIRKMLAQMPPLLRKDYGSFGPYKQEQVVATMERNRLALRTMPIALAVFCNEAEFARAGAGGDEEYEELRRAIGVLFFAGQINFSINDIVHFSESQSAHGTGPSDQHIGSDHHH